MSEPVPLDLNPPQEEKEQKSCPICLETMENPMRLECKHEFCARCLCTWFRRTGSCPLCRDQASQDDRDSYTSLKALFSIKKSLSRRKDAPKRLKALVKLHKQKMARIKAAQRELREWKKSDEGKRYKELNKKHRKLQRRTWTYSRFCSKRAVERQIALWPVVPLVLKK